ncbi:hypothetical protein ACI2KR_07695 [Pseudomonas luteola]
MKKIMKSMLYGIFAIFVTSCSMVSPITQKWDQQVAEKYRGSFNKDGNTGTYLLVTSHKDSSAGFHEVAFKYELNFIVLVGSYHRSFKGSAITKRPIVVEAERKFLGKESIVSVDFNDMEPFVYANIWPVVKASWISRLQLSGAN